MTTQLQLRRGVASAVAAFIAAIGEIVVDTTNKRIVVGDGVTAGGVPAARLADVGILRYVIKGVQLNTLGDTAVAIPMPPGVTRFGLRGISAGNASTSLASGAVQVGVYTAPAQGGAAIASQQGMTALTATAANVAGNMAPLTLNGGSNTAWQATTLYFNVGTLNGAPATVDITITLLPLS